MNRLDERVVRVLKSREERGLIRRLQSDSVTDNSHLTDFSSNDYLSLSRNKPLIAKVKECLSHSAVEVLGSGGSRLLDGDSLFHRAVERRLSAFYNGSDALLFNSGYDANMSIFSTLPDRNDVVIYDELIHASVHDGMRASRTAHTWACRHSNVTHLEELLHKALISASSVFVAVEAVYSMDGDLCPLQQIVDLVRQHPNVHIIVDEAHSTGYVGGGRGLVSHLGLDRDVAVKLNTFGKALCAAGAVVLCGSHIRRYLVNYARPLIFSTSMTLSNLHIIDMVHRALAEGALDEDIAKLDANARYLKRRFGMQQTGTPIIPILTPHSKELAGVLQARGFLVRHITFPTVPKGSDRVRVCVHAHNSIEEIDSLVVHIDSFLLRRSSKL